MNEFTPGPWEYVPSTEHHGPYVAAPWGGDVCDCYTMTKPREWSTASGGDSKPIPFQGECADQNARLIAAAPELFAALAEVNKLVAEAAREGFNCHRGDWAERLFKSQQETSDALRKAVGKEAWWRLHERNSSTAETVGT